MQLAKDTTIVPSNKLSAEEARTMARFGVIYAWNTFDKERFKQKSMNEVARALVELCPNTFPTVGVLIGTHFSGQLYYACWRESKRRRHSKPTPAMTFHQKLYGALNDDFNVFQAIQMYRESGQLTPYQQTKILDQAVRFAYTCFDEFVVVPSNLEKIAKPLMVIFAKVFTDKDSLIGSSYEGILLEHVMKLYPTWSNTIKIEQLKMLPSHLIGKAKILLKETMARRRILLKQGVDLTFNFYSSNFECFVNYEFELLYPCKGNGMHNIWPKIQRAIQRAKTNIPTKVYKVF